MKKSSAVLIILILPLLTTIAFLPIPHVDAWGHATHYFIINEAVDNISNDSWADAFEYYTEELLSGSVAPDVLWQDWDNHLYYPGDTTGNAPASAAKWYDFARANFSVANWEDGFYAAGVMAHYYADPCVPVHTDVLWDGHSAYESDVSANLGDLTLSIPSETMVSNVSQLVVDNATYANQYYDMIVDAYPTVSDEAIATNSTIKTLTENCLSMAIDGLLSLFYNLTIGLDAPDVTITFEHVAMIDFAHDNDYYASGGLTAINQTLAIAGYDLIEQTSAITTGSLATVDLLVMTCAKEAYTVDELSAIGTWFQSGDKSILITGRGDHPSSDTDLLYPNSVLTEISSNIRLNDDNVYMEGTFNAWYNDIFTIPDPADTLNMTFDVASVSFFSPSSLYFLVDDPILPVIYADVSAYQTNQDPETPDPTVIYDDVIDGEYGTQIPLAAIEEIGTGRLFVAGTTFFSDFDHGDPVFDNIQLLKNFLDWATGSRSENTIPDIDEVGPRISGIEWDPTSPADGASVNVSVTVTDPSGVASVLLKYHNGATNVITTMTNNGGDVYSALISDVTSGSVNITIEANDTDANSAIRASYTITWESSTTIPTETLILIGAAAGVIVLVAVIVVIGKRRGA